MPDRQLVAKELADIFKIVAHPDRIRIIEELRVGEKSVNTLIEQLDLPGSRVSQHLSLMRAHRIVEERRDGRHHYYSLTQPEMADWIIEGLGFIEGRLSGVSKSAISKARQLWTSPTENESGS
ncbi:MAG: DNA-binding transcriptional ArsR family regulator [Cyclobacteriaceae bacterium]